MSAPLTINENQRPHSTYKVVAFIKILLVPTHRTLQGVCIRTFYIICTEMYEFIE